VGKIAVVTDSVACVPQDPEGRYNIHVVPFQVIWDGHGHLLIFAIRSGGLTSQRTCVIL
jgi:hypothetical protein